MLGLPRTGTTAMQRLLMADPRNQGLECWLGADPQPRSPREMWASDPSFRACRAALAAMRAAAPGVAAIHAMAADPVAAVEAAYGHFGIPLTKQSETALRGWCSTNHQRGQASRSPAALPFGLDRDALRERFSRYQG